MPRTIAPEPPRIDCSERAPADPLPGRPKFGPLPPQGSPRHVWLSYIGRLHAIWGAHDIRMAGAYESVVTQRVETADCLDRERAEKRIR
jgi:hypothetical protein